MFDFRCKPAATTAPEALSYAPTPPYIDWCLCFWLYHKNTKQALILTTNEITEFHTGLHLCSLNLKCWVLSNQSSRSKSYFMFIELRFYKKKSNVLHVFNKNILRFLGHVWFINFMNRERKIITFICLGNTNSESIFLIKRKVRGKSIPLRFHGIEFPL